MRDDLPGPGAAGRLKSERAVAAARRLRKTMTPAEQALWRELRGRGLDRSHFRRQAPFGPFIVDFVCHGAKLVVEVDGGAHNAPDAASRDAERQRWIEGRGYRVLRYENARVLADPKRAASEILAEASLRLKRGA